VKISKSTQTTTIVYNINPGYIHKIEDLENSVYLCWMKLFAMSFWYHDYTERQFRFFQLIAVIRSANFIDIETANMLFEAITEFGDDVMTMKFYELLKGLGIVNSYNLFEAFVNKIIQQEKISESIHNEKNLSTSHKKTNNFTNNRTIDYINKLESVSKSPYETNNFNKRVLYKKNSEDSAEDIFFETEDSCMECRETIQFNTVICVINLDTVKLFEDEKTSIVGIVSQM
jgi:hypothetical protein